MRTNPILTITVIVVALASLGGAYYFLPGDPLPTQVEEMKPAVSSTASLGVKDTPGRDEHRNQAANPEQQRQLALMHDKIATLEARLRDMEVTANEQVRNQLVSRPDTPVANNGPEKANAKKLSEDDFGHWLDAALVTGDFDREETRLTTEEMATSLAQVSGLNLADMQCGERFCRASFFSDNGKSPNMAELFGASAFIESGFTISEPDGRVRVYFTQPGESLSELRSEAQESGL